MDLQGRQLRAERCEGFLCNHRSLCVKSRCCVIFFFLEYCHLASFLLSQPFKPKVQVRLFSLSSSSMCKVGEMIQPEHPHACLFNEFASTVLIWTLTSANIITAVKPFYSWLFSCLLTHTGSELQACTEKMCTWNQHKWNYLTPGPLWSTESQCGALCLPLVAHHCTQSAKICQQDRALCDLFMHLQYLFIVFF